MAQLTLRTLLAYLDDTLEPALARELGEKVAASEVAQQLVERIKVVTRRRGLKSPTAAGPDAEVADPNTVAEYLSDTLDGDQLKRVEETCLESDPHLAEVAACHQILTMLLTEPVRVPPRARQRMYALVPPPASVPNRRPGKALPVGGLSHRQAEKAEADDADAALLLGLGRYGGGSAARRAGLVAAGVGLVALLAVAVLMALPRTPPAPPESSPGGLYAALPPAQQPPPDRPKDKDPDPKPAGKKDETAAKTPDTPPVKDKDPDPAPPPAPKKDELVTKAAPPKADRAPLGRVEGLNALVVSRPEDGPNWVRLDPAGDPTVTSQDQVVALPGYKADVRLDSKVVAHLWGNVPDLLPARLLESRVRFHLPERLPDNSADRFDADLSLLAGRVYLTTTKPGGAKARVRLPGGEVWDVTLPNPEAVVAVEVVTGYDPGAAFAVEGGPAPRVEARAAVLRGAAGLAAPDRFKAWDKVAAPAVVEWDSKGGTVADPRPVADGDPYWAKFPVVGSAAGTAVQKALAELAGRVATRDGTRVALLEVLTAPADAGPNPLTPIAVYGEAAIATGADPAAELNPLVDLLTDEGRGFARVAAVNALAAWVARDPKNTALLQKPLAAKVGGEGVAEVVLRLLRGYVNPAKPDPADLDRLVGFLSHPSVAVRELALWNLVNFADPSAAAVPELLPNVAATGPAYEKAVKAWAARVEEVKKRPAPAKK